jgi:steroid delta-isomerase-like uncharacterized protein
MSNEANKAIAQALYGDLFSQGKLDVADAIIADEYVNHDRSAPPGGWPGGPAGFKAVVQTYRGAFPDLQFTIDDLVADGDRVVTRWTGRGINSGSLLGMPPSGRRIEVTGISIERFAGGKIVETWVNFDMFGMLQQVGALPAPGTAGL